MQVFSRKIHGFQCNALQTATVLYKGLQSVLIGELDARLKDIADGKEEMISLEKQAANVLMYKKNLRTNLRTERLHI